MSRSLENGGPRPTATLSSTTVYMYPSRTTAQILSRGLLKLFREEGLASVKIFTAYSKRGLMLDDGKLYRLMQLCSKHNVLVMATVRTSG
jgi:dihydroorotase-like cyclic amidohydrolase